MIIFGGIYVYFVMRKIIMSLTNLASLLVNMLRPTHDKKMLARSRNLR